LIYAPHGAFIIFSKSYFSKGGIIDDGYFLYGEENSTAAQAAKLNMKIGYVPEIKLIHKESMSTGKGLNKKKYAFQKQAFNYIKKKYTIFKID